MKKLLLALGFLLWSSAAFAQCTGVFPANSLCGNLTASPAPPSWVTASGTIIGPASSTLNGLPLWANTLGTQLKDGAGQTVAGAYTWSGAQTYSATNTYNGIANFASTFQINGNAITFPGVAATLAYLAGSQTYTGNNIWSGNNTYQTGTFNFTGTFQIGGATVALPISTTNGGTGVSAPTANTVPVNQGASPQTAITLTEGQVIGNAFGSANPAAQSGAWKLLATLTASASATLADTTHFTAPYKEFKVVYKYLIPAAGSTTLMAQLTISGTPIVTGYLGSGGVPGTTSTVAATTYIALSNTTSVISTYGSGVNGELTLLGNASGGLTGYQSYYGVGTYTFTGPNISPWVVGGSLNNASTPNGIQFCFSTAVPTCNTNIASGYIEIYGRL